MKGTPDRPIDGTAERRRGGWPEIGAARTHGARTLRAQHGAAFGRRDNAKNPRLGARKLRQHPGKLPPLGMVRRQIAGIGKQPLEQRDHQAHDHQRGRKAGRRGRCGGDG
ncbi:MAG: hypothetical protein NT133_19360 [Alphaproteobacteria bacterium]|nr:hypothetical protein [Alphaproteobacteria bacterium]